MTRHPIPRMLQRLAVVLVTGVLALSASATSASAGPTNSPTLTSAADAALLADCAVNTVCIYQDRDFGGQVLSLWSGVSLPTLHSFECLGCDSPKHGAGDGNWGDQMSGWINNTLLTYCWYYDINFASFVSVMPPASSMAFLGRRAQDEASSIRPC